VELAAQPYVGIARSITMQTFPEIADRLPEVFAWLAGRGVEPTGPPFFKYNVIDMERELQMEAGVPVAATPTASGEVFAGVLPAGRYATVTHTGDPQELVEVTRQLLEWAAGEGLEFDKTDLPRGQRWTCRLERLLTNPAEEPDMNKWQTQLLFKLA
jgi:effector-binding domain-containing protein